MLGKGAGGDCVEAETAFLLASAAAVGERLKRLNGFCIAVKNDLAVSVADGLTGGLTVAWAVGFAVAGGAGFVFSGVAGGTAATAAASCAWGEPPLSHAETSPVDGVAAGSILARTGSAVSGLA